MGNTATSVRALKTELSKIKDDALLVGFLKGRLELPAELKRLDSMLGNIISTYFKNNGFNGDRGEVKNIYTSKRIKNIVLIGLGEEEKYSLDILSNTIADASKKLRDNGAKSFSIFLSSFSQGRLKYEEAAEKAALGALMGLYKFTEYKSKGDNSIKKQIRLISIVTNLSKSLGREIRYASVVADSINKTRSLVNTPPNIATPEHIAAYAKKLAKSSNLNCTIFEARQIKKLRMGCFMGVAQGSANRPKLVILEYRGAKKQKPIAIVGKGITFDSGGLNLKPYPFILNMKDDKGGAIAAMHIIWACSKLKLPVNVIVLMPLCENMPGSTSFRPDDVLTARNGTTVEIRNTDAEGRLILADALAYAAELKPQAIVDIATLTGASLIALGYAGTPFLSTDQKLAEKIKDASKKSLEKVWEFPLWQEYEESIKSDVADLKHISDESDAGVIIGATFLKNFVGSVPWAHIDIGTTVWSKVDKGVLVKGATGVTVRLMVEMLSNWK